MGLVAQMPDDPAAPPPTPSGWKRWGGRLGWVWLVLLVVGWKVFFHRIIHPQHHLYLVGESASMLDYVVGLSLLLLSPITLLRWSVIFVVEALRSRPTCLRPALKIILFTLVMLLPGLPLPDLPPNPITPETEPIYLRIAEQARELERSGVDLGWVSLDPNSVNELPSEAVGAVEQIRAMVPDYWPRFVLYIAVSDDYVQLARGSGMLGQVGVRIYDQGPPEIYPDEQLAKNPYLPRQTRITDRLWFFTSD